jgi:hypothetical protein
VSATIDADTRAWRATSTERGTGDVPCALDAAVDMVRA